MLKGAGGVKCSYTRGRHCPWDNYQWPLSSIRTGICCSCLVRLNTIRPMWLHLASRLSATGELHTPAHMRPFLALRPFAGGLRIIAASLVVAASS